MSEMKPIPAPWVHDGQSFDGEEDIIIEHEGCPIITIRGSNDMSCIDEDDLPKINSEIVKTAYLVIAAPDLLEALSDNNACLRVMMAKQQPLTAVWDALKDLIDANDRLISKARGL